MDPAATPLVSILIPCFNAERWIKQAIESALEQSYPNTEVIVIDDGSEDGSLEIIKGFSEKIRWEARSNQGGNATRNRLLELSRGEWLQYLDADDYLLPGKIGLQLGAVTQDVDVVYSPSLIERDGTREELEIPEPHDPWILLARWFLPQTGSPLWRKQAIVDVGGWSVDQPCCQEHELYFRLLATAHGSSSARTPNPSTESGATTRCANVIPSSSSSSASRSKPASRNTSNPSTSSRHSG